MEPLERAMAEFRGGHKSEEELFEITKWMSRRKFGTNDESVRAAVLEKRKTDILERNRKLDEVVHECIVCQKKISKRDILQNAFMIDNHGVPTSILRESEKFIRVCGENCRKIAVYSVYPYNHEILGMPTIDGVYVEEEQNQCNLPYFLVSFSKDFYSRNISSDIEKSIEEFYSFTSMWLEGSPGAGKTGMAVSYMLEARRREKTAYFVKFYDLVEEILRVKFGNSTKLVSKYTKYDLLVIDDACHTYITDYGKSVLFSLFNSIYERRKKIIVTSNYDLDSVCSWVDGRLPSRMKSYLKQINFGEKDLRNL